jgi:imidazolonepropionase-like amidohydrolase
MSAILFRNCAIVDGTSKDRRPGMDVLVEGKTIKEVSDKPIRPKKAETIDVKGRTLMPGLIDCHAHAIAVQVNLMRLGEKPDSLVALEAKDILEGMLMRGFTTIRDAGGADFGLQEAVERDLIKGPRMFIAGKALSQTGGHADLRPRTARIEACACGLAGPELGRIADGVPEVRRAARDELRKGANQIKIMASGGVASPHDPIWNLQYSEDEVRAIVEEAKAWKTYVMAHAYTAEAIRRSIDFGVRTIEHANLIDRATAEHAARHGVFVVPTLVTYWALEREAASLGLVPSSVAKIKDVSKVGLVALDLIKQAGVKIGFGTDLLGEMHRHQSREFLIRREVCSPFEIIQQATTVSAEVVKMDGKLGVVQAGAIADLLVVDGNPLRDIGVLAAPEKNISHIMKNGRFYKRAA